MAGAPQYAGVAMAATIMPAVAQASAPARDTYLDAVGHRFEAASEYGHWELTLASVETLNTVSGTRFGLMFTASTDTPPAGVYRLSVADDDLSHDDLPDAQLFVVGSRRRRHPASVRSSYRRTPGPRP